jgi:4-cresol dehydrogenase (hydroxylating) flavoprotein subunit
MRQRNRTLGRHVRDTAEFTTKGRYYSHAGPIPPVSRNRSWPIRRSACGASVARGIAGRRSPICFWTVRRDPFASIPRVRFFFSEDRRQRPRYPDHRADTMKGIPKLTEFGFLNRNGGGGHAGFPPVSPITGQDAINQWRMVSGRVREHGSDFLA